MFEHLLSTSTESDDAAQNQMSAAEIAADQRVFKKSIRAFNNYATHARAALAKKRSDYAKVTSQLRELIPSEVELASLSSSSPSTTVSGSGMALIDSLAPTSDTTENVFERRLAAVEGAVTVNATFLAAMVLAIGEDPTPPTPTLNSNKRLFGPPHLAKDKDAVVLDSDMDKVRSTLRQFVRDWSDAGKKERHDTYHPIMEAIDKLYGNLPTEQRGKLKVLVPGAGLGRLAFDIAKEGYTTQGNEFSFYMLIASNFALNSIKRQNQYAIHPWIHSFSNSQTASHQLRPVYIPDTVPGSIPSTADFSMVAGDFIEIYGGSTERDEWDILVSCYFIDTAKNIFEYLRVIWNALKPGGVWINHGPLLYHFEGMRNEMSVELNLDEVKAVAKKMGFVFEEERMMPSTYTSNDDCNNNIIVTTLYSFLEIAFGNMR
ncbi:hypothetical protein HK100_002019 [Physocladia obscura]|uniref:carnosine N-methyltransferase n=1 Tax=Physocladia obscura TaxID=109957 RepID=A0AAD5XAM0_9FUNG|nr:hypothetical protein HK100_002019 [Physocladia obscura]